MNQLFVFSLGYSEHIDFILTIVDYDFTHALKQEEKIKNEKPVKTYNLFSLILKSVVTLILWIVIIILCNKFCYIFPSITSIIVKVFLIYFAIGLIINAIVLSIRLFVLNDKNESSFNLLVESTEASKLIKKRFIIIGITIGVIILLFIFISVLTRGKTSLLAEANYYEKVDYYGEIEKKYGALGSYKFSNITYEVKESMMTSIKVWYPTNDLSTDKKYPVVLFTNGANGPYPLYETVFKHLSTWGFIAVGNNDKSPGKGNSASITLDFIIKQNTNETSPLKNKIDLNHIGIWGHSEGGSGAINAATKFDNSNYIKAVFVASASTMEVNRRLAAGFDYDLTKLNKPFFSVAGTKFGDSTMISPTEGMIENFNSLPKETPAIIARRKDKEHFDMVYVADGYMTAFFRYYLMNDNEAVLAFKGENTEIFSNEKWQNVTIKDIK